MPVCRHCDQFYQAGSDHDAVCPAAKVQLPDTWEVKGVGVDPTHHKDPSLWDVIRASFRGRLKSYRAKHRLPAICKKWNREIKAKFAEDVTEQEADPDFNVDPMIVFKWNQLVWQEILMWNSLDEQVTQSEFLWMCDRRGFSLVQRRYLEEMLEFMDLKGWE